LARKRPQGRIDGGVHAPAEARRELGEAPPPAASDYGQLKGKGVAPVDLREGTITVGRGTENDVVLDDPKVSRRHARIRCVGGTCHVQDLDSSNGTFINGERIAEGTLTPGSEVRFGGTTLVRESRSKEGASAWLHTVGQRVPVTPAGLVIGRAADVDLRLEDRLASRRHARIESEAGRYVVSDLDSTNGTFVNERPVQFQRLQDGDRIRIGSTTMIFHR
jgi:pSer/pThr/pTyr-binding forkhead associated (FHA) protein